MPLNNSQSQNKCIINNPLHMIQRRDGDFPRFTKCRLCVFAPPTECTTNRDEANHSALSMHQAIKADANQFATPILCRYVVTYQSLKSFLCMYSSLSDFIKSIPHPPGWDTLPLERWDRMKVWKRCYRTAWNNGSE